MKKIITIIIVVLVVLGFGYFLFKASPQQTQQANSSPFKLDTSGAKQLSAVPAFDPAVDHFQGNAKAKNVFIEYADFQCPACASYSTMLKDLTTTFPDTVFVYRYFPLEQIHPNAVESALAAEAAGTQGKYWEMHNILFQKQTEWEGISDPLNTFAQYAQSVGVANIDQFKSDITNQKNKDIIQNENNQALGLSLPGTPTFFFNGHLLQNQDLAGLLQQSQQYLNK
jgi:protein-disulfide isomerase